jgi:hypothetical protein
MANIVGSYDPIFYANETLLKLYNVLGVGGRVYRGYDMERRAVNKGSVIEIKTPGSFTAQDAPGPPEDVVTDTTQITINFWKEVRFAVPHDELAFTGEIFIQQHIQEAAYEIARVIDTSVRDLYLDIPYVYGYDNTAVAQSTILQPRKILRDNAVDIDMPGMFHFMVDSDLEAQLLEKDWMSSVNNAGDAATAPLMRGTLGTRFNTEMFATQHVPEFTPGSGSGGGDVAGTAAATAVNSTTLTINAMTDTQEFKKGDNFVIAGDTTRYVLTADATVSGTALAASIFPKLATATTGGEVVTFTDYTNTNTRANSIMFHEHAFAIAFAQLPAPSAGANSFTAVDPQSGISLRAFRGFNLQQSREEMVVDALWGVKTLNPKLAVRAYPTN